MLQQGQVVGKMLLQHKMASEVLEPSALILPRIADTTAAGFVAAPTGSIAYDNNTGKLGFVTATGVSEETITSA